MPRQVPAFWRTRGLWATLLLPLALLFARLAGLRRALYRWGVLRVVKLPVPVIVVGNIAVGGSGKTPVVDWLVRELRIHGYRPGIVSRGYGSAINGVAVLPAHPDAAIHGDEPALLARLTGCPVAIGADRPAAASALLEAHPECDVIVSDDGMQHYRLARDIEIAVVDEATLGNRHLLPAGPLREPASRLRGVDLVIAHGALAPKTKHCLPATGSFAMRLSGQDFIALDGSGMRCSAADLARRPVHALAGIGRPERFFEQLRSMGLDVVEHPFPDHHGFVPEDLDFAPGAPKVLTSKDAVKCASFAPAGTWEFPVSAQIDAGAAEIILEKLRHGRPTA